MAGKAGGAWKVAYADFVTAMMAFFLVMWITAQNKPVKQAIARYFNDPMGGSSKGSSTSTLVPMRDRVGSPPIVGPHKGGLGRGKGAPRPVAKSASTEDPKGGMASRPTLLMLQDGDQSHIGTVLLFPEHSAELDKAAQNLLSDVVPLMLGKPNKIEIRGHASKRPLPKDSPFKNAWEISYARCLATMRFLEQKGVAADRLRLSQAGPYEPQPSDLDAAWPIHNSRVEVYMLGEFADGFNGMRAGWIDRQSSADGPATASHD
jgi:chemotaxis protein MotB